MNRYREGEWVTEAQPASRSSRILSMLVCSDIKSKTGLALDAIVSVKFKSKQISWTMAMFQRWMNVCALEYLPYEAV